MLFPREGKALGAQSSNVTRMNFTASVSGGAVAEIAIKEANDPDAFELLREPWDRLVEEAGGSIFQTWEWAFAAWKHFGGGSRLRILTAHRDGKLVGIAPLAAKASGGRIVEIKGLSFFGVASDTQDFLVARDHYASVSEAFGAHLAQSEDWDVLNLDLVPADSRLTPPFLEAMERRGHSVFREDGPANLVIVLPGSLEEYLASLGMKTRQEMRREYRRIMEAGAVDVCSPQGEIDGYLDTLLHLHALRFAHKGTRSLLADPHLSAFYRDVVRMLHARGLVRLSILRVGQEPVAAHLAFWHRDRVYWHQCGFDPSSPWSRHSPVRGLMVDSLAQAIRMGMKEVAFGREGEAYKLDFAPQRRTTYCCRVVSSRLSTQVRLVLQGATRRVGRIVRAVASGLKLPPVAFWG